MNGYVIYGFAGVGKTTYCKNHPECIDLEESNFRYLDKIQGENNKSCEKIINKNFPQNYYGAISESLKKYKYVFVSYNGLEYCRQNMIDYSIILPKKSCKNEYIKRYIDRQNPAKFIDNISKNFDRYLEKEKKDMYAEHIIFLNKNIPNIILC